VGTRASSSEEALVYSGEMQANPLNPKQFLREVNPNQQALPGLEEHAHPFAKYLAQGLTLNYEHLPAHTSVGGISGSIYHHDEAHSLAARKPRPDGSSEIMAHIDWKGRTNKYGTYPGEIDFVSNRSMDPGINPSSRHPGLAQALFHSAHHFDFGQNTVPVHSTLRTPLGEKFAQATGGPTPPTGPESGWKPPEGFHPYEWHDRRRHEESVRRIVGAKKARGQGTLF
jgi:hypothetical protein